MNSLSVKRGIFSCRWEDLEGYMEMNGKKGEVGAIAS